MLSPAVLRVAMVSVAGGGKTLVPASGPSETAPMQNKKQMKECTRGSERRFAGGLSRVSTSLQLHL